MSKADKDQAQPADDTLTRHRAFAAVLEGERPMGWAEWALPIHDAQYLTPEGRRVALWAADALRRAFGEKFLSQAWQLHRARPPAQLWEHPTRHPVFGQGLWPAMNGAPWAIANLLQLTAQLELLAAVTKPVRRSMREHPDPVNWIHGLLQLEVAALGLRAGWRPTFEPALGTGRRADVALDSPSRRVLVETTTMRMSDREVKAFSAAREASGRVMFALHDIGMRHGVHVTGEVNDLTPEHETTIWLAEVEQEARATAADGQSRNIPAPTSGMVYITRDAGEAQGQSLTISGPVVSSDPFGRLSLKVREKAQQALGSSQPVWVRVEESAGIWLALHQSGLSLADKLTFLTPLVRQLLDPHPDLAGVILAPAVLWAGLMESAHLHETISGPDAGSVAVRSALPGGRARETIMVSRTSSPGAGLEAFIHWYEDEAAWLDWALTTLGHPPFGELVRAQPGSSD